MNSEQVKSLVRQAMLFIGGILAGTSLVSKFFTPDQVVTILTSETVLTTLTGIAMSAVASIWAFVTRSDKNLVAAAAHVPGVAGVITQPTAAGRDLATSVPSDTVVPARTDAATTIAHS